MIDKKMLIRRKALTFTKFGPNSKFFYDEINVWLQHTVLHTWQSMEHNANEPMCVVLQTDIYEIEYILNFVYKNIFLSLIKY